MYMYMYMYIIINTQMYHCTHTIVNEDSTTTDTHCTQYARTRMQTIVALTLVGRLTTAPVCTRVLNTSESPGF